MAVYQDQNNPQNKGNAIAIISEGWGIPRADVQKLLSGEVEFSVLNDTVIFNVSASPTLGNGDPA